MQGNKRSGVVKLGLTSAIALTIAGCSPHPTLEAGRCIDPNGRVVDIRYCEDRNSSGYYRYYGGGGREYYSSGGVSNGSPSDVSRGGFGSTGEGHGGSGAGE